MVWNLRLHGDPGGPTSITGTARIVPTIFYIIITSLQDTRGCRKLCRGWSGGISVLVDESTTAGRSNDLEVSIWLVCRVGGNGWSLIECTVGPVRVVVIDVVDDKLVELAAVPDDGAVEELSSKGADPAFGERVRHGGAHRCGEDLHAFGSEDLVEGVDELAGAVAHERSGVGELVAVLEQQVPGGLGGPDAAGVVCDRCEVHGAGPDVDEEQQVEPAQRDGFDGGEVAGDGGLGPQELRPGDFRACGCGVDSGVL